MTQPSEKPPSYLNPEVSGAGDVAPERPEDEGSEVRCRRCERPVPPGSRFCNHCGAGLPRTCAACSAENEAGNRYCMQCGRELSPGVAGVQAPAAAQQSVEPAAVQMAAEAGEPVPGASVAVPETTPGAPYSGPNPDATPTLPAAPGSLTCPRCSKSNEQAARYCYACGLPLDDVERGPCVGDTGSESVEVTRPTDSGARVVAFIIDYLIVLAGVFVVLVIWAASDPTYSERVDSDDNSFAVVVYASYVTVGSLYGVVSITFWGQTLGKRLMKLKVVDLEGRRPTFGRAVGRHAASYLSSFFFIGYLMGLMRRDQRALHDLMAGTWVVSKPR